jgi:hypothetical protein
MNMGVSTGGSNFSIHSCYKLTVLCTVRMLSSYTHVINLSDDICSFNVDGSYSSKESHAVLNIDSKGHGVLVFLNDELIGAFLTLTEKYPLLSIFFVGYFLSSYP